MRVSERIWGYTVSYVVGEGSPKHFLIERIPQGYQFLGTNQVVHKQLYDLITYHEVSTYLFHLFHLYIAGVLLMSSRNLPSMLQYCLVVLLMESSFSCFFRVLLSIRFKCTVLFRFIWNYRFQICMNERYLQNSRVVYLRILALKNITSIVWVRFACCRKSAIEFYVLVTVRMSRPVIGVKSF